MNKVIYFPHFGIPEIPEEHVSWPQGSGRLRTGASEPRLLLAPEYNVNRCQKISRDAVFGSSQANVCHSKCEATAADVAGGSLKARLLAHAQALRHFLPDADGTRPRARCRRMQAAYYFLFCLPRAESKYLLPSDIG